MTSKRKKTVRSPSLEQLRNLLISDPATAAFVGDAKAFMDDFDGDDEDPHAYICEILHNVSSEIDPHYGLGREFDESDGVEGAKEDLKHIATSCKRGAILLLCAAFEAEQRLARAERPTRGKSKKEVQRPLFEVVEGERRRND